MPAIRTEEKADHTRVFEIQAGAFGRRNEADLVEILRRSADPHLSLVAEEGGRILGHIFFSPVEIESSRDSPGVAGLAPVAVDPAHQGLGIGAALIRTGLLACPALGWQAVFLVGSPLFDSVLQVHEVSAGVLGGNSGRVRFHPAFAETGCG